MADTPMPRENPGGVPASRNDDDRDPATEMEVEENAQPEPDSSLPPEDDPEVEETEQQPT